MQSEKVTSRSLATTESTAKSADIGGRLLAEIAGHLLGRLDLAAGLRGATGLRTQGSRGGVGAQTVGHGVTVVGLMVGLVDAAGRAEALRAGITCRGRVALRLVLRLELFVAELAGLLAHRDDAATAESVVEAAAVPEAATVLEAAVLEATAVLEAAAVPEAVVQATVAKAADTTAALELILVLSLEVCPNKGNLQGANKSKSSEIHFVTGRKGFRTWKVKTMATEKKKMF